MATIDRALEVLRLFAGEQSTWTVESAAQRLSLSQSTAYQYFRSLTEAGLLSTYKTGQYVIGPAIIELDRQTRLRDPLIQAARETMDWLSEGLTGEDDIVLLCRLYKLAVMCVDQRVRALSRAIISYERGRPMPLERGSASKIILAHLGSRVLRRYYAKAHPDEADPTWQDFLRPLRVIRRNGFCIASGELDAGRVGVSAPVFASEGEIIGSIGLVLSDAALIDGKVSANTCERVMEAGRRVSAHLRQMF